MSVNGDVIPLTSLSIIRGRTLFKHGGRNYSVFISHNYQPVGETTVGLRELQLPSLHGQLFVPLPICRTAGNNGEYVFIGALLPKTGKLENHLVWTDHVFFELPRLKRVQISRRTKRYMLGK